MIDIRGENIENNIVIKEPLNIWFITTIILLGILSVVGIWHFRHNQVVNTKTTPTQKSIISPSSTYYEPTLAMEQNNTSISSHQLRYGNLAFYYPKDWAPIFTKQTDIISNVIYFAETDTEFQNLARCTLDSVCDTYPFKLSISNNSAVPQNLNIESFVRQYQKEIIWDKLKESKVGGHSVWQGYTDDQKHTYQMVVSTGADQDATNTDISVQYLILNTQDSTNDRVQKFIDALTSLQVNKYKETKEELINPKNGFIMTIKSPVKIQDYFYLQFILQSILGSQDLSKQYSYLLFISTNEGSTNKLEYPRENYLEYKYYLLTDSTELKANTTYGTDQISIQLEDSLTPNLGNYLANKKYCMKDSDCMYRTNFCTYGAFNAYHKFFTPWGCGPGDYEGLGNSLEIQDKLKCEGNIKILYDSLVCKQNICTAINPRPVCE